MLGLKQYLSKRYETEAVGKGRYVLSLQVVLVDSRSHSFVREGSHCEFLLTSFDSSWGVLENPRHSLPPNTTCRYHFQGRRHENVWLSFVKYHAASADPAAYELGAECNARLRIWDGRIASNTGSPRQQVSRTPGRRPCRRDRGVTVNTFRHEVHLSNAGCTHVMYTTLV
jgi:hypothetical protein